jgi:uncharacterized protein (UPF0276 family)
MTATLRRDALGLGLRSRHYVELTAAWPELDYFEIITENFLGDAAAPRRMLDQVKERYPVVLHGVGLNLFGPAPPTNDYLDRVAALAQYVDAPFITDHLCWTGSHGVSHHDLLPVPYTEELVELGAERARLVQNHLGRPFGLENLSSYVQFEASTMSEHDFYAGVVERAGCGYLLDVNNAYVSSQNHGFSPTEYLARIDLSRVLQVHVAGHTRLGNGTLVDTHDQHVIEAVWELYRETFRSSPAPTLLEWDDHIPPLTVALAELERGRQVRA